MRNGRHVLMRKNSTLVTFYRFGTKIGPDHGTIFVLMGDQRVMEFSLSER